MCARATLPLFISILVEFADKRRSWQHVQLDLLYTIDRPRIILHAELSSWCLERVSIHPSLWIFHAAFRARARNVRFPERRSHTSNPRRFAKSITSELLSFLVREFSNERTRVERRAAYRKAKSKQLFTIAFSSYLKWITQAGLRLTDVA